ncbi:MAG: hypothetical protein KAW41_00020 [Candidatus Diapherotrites archaeon]|nr:hypothetical protein [Candidatus Diapherotrites archaeon]
MIPIVLAAVLTIVHFFSEKTANRVKEFHHEITSFSAGIFITYIMLEVLPELTMGVGFIGENVYLLLLLGFTAFHVAEKYVYQHVQNKKMLLKDLAHLHIAGFIADSFILGFALVMFFGIPLSGGKLGYLVFIPFLLHTLSSSISVRHIHEHFNSNKLEELVLSLSTVFGAVVATALELRAVAFYAVFSLVMGVLLYVVIRDLVPDGREGRPMYFLLGMALSLVLIAIAGMPA